MYLSEATVSTPSPSLGGSADQGLPTDSWFWKGKEQLGWLHTQPPELQFQTKSSLSFPQGQAGSPLRAAYRDPKS